MDLRLFINNINPIKLQIVLRLVKQHHKTWLEHESLRDHRSVLVIFTKGVEEGHRAWLNASREYRSRRERLFSAQACSLNMCAMSQLHWKHEKHTN